MAHTAHKVPLAERREPSDIVDVKATQLAGLIRQSKHFIVFTGAGVSTSAGVPDFRGPEGHWTLQAQGRERVTASVETTEVVPTPSHMALVELQNRGLLKYLISQNCDGLHRRSGIDPHMISELHGNSNREYCKACGKEYIRDEQPLHDHRTGRKCDECGGDLHDSIIHFSEDLPAKALRLARSHARKADLCAVLGSSLTVTPACDIPALVGDRKRANLVICNFQETPLDDVADLRVFAPTNDLMIRVMDKLGMQIPSFILKRRIIIGTKARPGQTELTVRGLDVDGTPSSFLRSVKLLNNRRISKTEPFRIYLRGHLHERTVLNVVLEFTGFYYEPLLPIKHECSDDSVEEKTYQLSFDPVSRTWETRQDDE